MAGPLRIPGCSFLARRLGETPLVPWTSYSRHLFVPSPMGLALPFRSCPSPSSVLGARKCVFVCVVCVGSMYSC